MAKTPDNKLTPVQFEIMQIVWESASGATVAEIWEQIGKTRDVARTTILNLVGRLEKRRWLKRKKQSGVYRYLATVDRETATADVAGQFVDDFFGGSTAEMVMSLLGNERISNSELDELRHLISSQSQRSKRGKKQ